MTRLCLNTQQVKGNGIPFPASFSLFPQAQAKYPLDIGS